jgi:hypothetical protein
MRRENLVTIRARRDSGFPAGSRQVSADCRTLDNHQNCSDTRCECPCHEPGSKCQTDYWPAPQEVA